MCTLMFFLIDKVDVKLIINFPNQQSWCEANYYLSLQIRSFCSPLIVHWVQTQQNNILEWTQRAINIEVLTVISGLRNHASYLLAFLQFFLWMRYWLFWTSYNFVSFGCVIPTWYYHMGSFSDLLLSSAILCR